MTDTLAPVVPAKQFSDLSFGERAKFTLHKYSLINGRGMDSIEAEAKVRTEYGLTPLDTDEQKKLAEPNIAMKIIDSKPLQMLGVSALVHETWGHYVEGKPVEKKEPQPPVLDRVKTYATEEIGAAKDHAVGVAQHAAQSVVTGLAHKVGLETKPIEMEKKIETAAVVPTSTSTIAAAPTTTAQAPAIQPTIEATPSTATPTNFFEQPVVVNQPIDVAAANTAVFTRVPDETGK